MFQKAHSQIAALQRVDEQIAALMEQRRKATDELRAIQNQINQEFQRVLELNRTAPADVRPIAMEELVFEQLKQPVELKSSIRDPKVAMRAPSLQMTGS
jgi:uncharacterized UPF0160 family protein